MIIKSKIKHSTWAGLLGLAIFLTCCIVYYIIFSANFESYDGESGFFQLALNSHDHEIYLGAIELTRNWGYEFSFLNNDIGIASIYLFLGRLFPVLVDPNYTLISLFFNCLTLCCCYWLYASISDQLGLGMLGKISFFSNTYFFYFAQLINKDMLTVLTFLLAVYLGLKRRLLVLFLLIPLMLLIRQQLLVFALIFIYLMHSPKPWLRIILVYLATSLVAGYISVVTPIIGDDSLGGGFSAYLVDFNQNYYIGYLIFNPIRVLQYIFDAYSSFSFWTEFGGVDTAKILRLPQLLIILLLLKPLSSLLVNFNYWLNTPVRPLVIVVVAFLMAWLMNPTVNARYVMLITPILVLFALYARKNKERVMPL